MRRVIRGYDCIQHGLAEDHVPDDLKKMTDADGPPPKWYESSVGKIAFSVFFAVLGAAVGWAILRWLG